MKLNIVLVEPEIPSNTGNISRTCSIIGAGLHLVHPLGFDIGDKQVKRAGLDYWSELDLHEYNSLNEVLEKNVNAKFFYCSTKAAHVYSDVDFKSVSDAGYEIFLVFGKETKGLPEELIHDYYQDSIRIPMLEKMRSLNLSNSVAVIAYEVLRQFNFEGLKDYGSLTKY